MHQTQINGTMMFYSTNSIHSYKIKIEKQRANWIFKPTLCRLFFFLSLRKGTTRSSFASFTRPSVTKYFRSCRCCILTGHLFCHKNPFLFWLISIFAVEIIPAGNFLLIFKRLKIYLQA